MFKWCPIHDLFSSMIVSVAISLLGVSYLYYGALGWTATAIAYFEVSHY